MSTLRADYGHMTVQQLVNHFKEGQLNLEPSFQRDSVWSWKDRRALIASVFHGLPLPSIFLYKRQDEGGGLVYDVLDGKQRLESIFMFMGLFRGCRYDAQFKLLPTDHEADWYDWTAVRKRGGDFAFNSYRIQTVEVSGDLADIIDLFVRINSTGKKLSSAEVMHAKHLNSPFLKAAGRLAERYEGYFRKHDILSAGAVTRMKHIELTCELMAAVARGGPLNKKKAVDEVIGGQAVEGKKLQGCRQVFVRVANRVGKMFPRLRETRFANAVDYYSLFLLIHELDERGCVLTNAARNRQAEKLLVWLTTGVDQVREQQRKAVGASADQQLFADYLMTVQGDTDSQATRERRATILRGLLAGLFEKTDEKRLFSPEQRRLIWHSSAEKRCSNPACPRPKLDWTNFTVDHVKPFAKGGKTAAKNAALLCVKCNSKKGAR